MHTPIFILLYFHHPAPLRPAAVRGQVFIHSGKATTPNFLGMVTTLALQCTGRAACLCRDVQPRRHKCWTHALWGVVSDSSAQVERHGMLTVECQVGLSWDHARLVRIVSDL